MKYRPLGTTGLSVSEVGFGAWGIGGGLWSGSKDEESFAALRRAAGLGITFFDTALAYNEGHSERMLARFREGLDDAITIATKIPPKNRKWPAAAGTRLKDAFPPAYIAECAEQSLRNLAAERIDLLQFHVWSDEWHDHDEWKSAVERLTEQGKVRFWGISINDHQPANVLKTLETGFIRTVQVIYNIFDQSPEDELFPFCAEKGIGVIVRVPLDEGGLTGAITPESSFPGSDFRANYFRGSRKKEVFDRASALSAMKGDEAADLPELALRFCLSHPAVSTIIPGMRTEDHVVRNASVSDGRLLSEGLRIKLRAHAWQRNFYSRD